MSDSGGRGEWGDLLRGVCSMAGSRWQARDGAGSTMCGAGEGMCSGMLEIPGSRCWARVCSRGCRLGWAQDARLEMVHGGRG